MLLAGFLLLTGCPSEQKGQAASGEKEAVPATRAKDELAKAEEEARALPGAETATASVSGKSDPLCVGRFELAPPTTRKVGAFDAEIAGYKVTLTGPTGPLVLGVLSDIKEDTPENLFNLKRYVKWFKDKGVQAVLVAGDTGETEDAIVHALTVLAEPGWPVFVIIGNREARSVFADALSTVQEKHPNVFNLNVRRLVQLPGLAVLSLPGYHDPRFIHAETGCQYFIEDVKALEKVAAEEAKGPALLISHGPPRGADPQAIDYAVEAGNVGDPNINALIETAKIPFGVFGNIHEAGGKATDLTGKNIVPEKTFVDHLYLNPGPADSIPWKMNDGTESQGMAAVLTVKDGKAAYEIYRAPALTDAERAEAQKLAASLAKAEAPAAQAAEGTASGKATAGAGGN
ncbi:MAG: hypothetical protein D6729_17235 [Deltaproteobacteria bacterium]|nr:MAG: hypothetical protein D6729_17235 [Deltaproteobacteria bacterium]